MTLSERHGAAIGALQRSHAAHEVLHTQLSAATSEIEVLRQKVESMQVTIARLEVRLSAPDPRNELIAALQHAKVEAEARDKEQSFNISELQLQLSKLVSESALKDEGIAKELKQFAARIKLVNGETEAIGSRQEGIRTEVEEMSKSIERHQKSIHKHEMALRDMGSLGYRPLDVMASLAVVQEQVKSALDSLYAQEDEALDKQPTSRHPQAWGRNGPLPNAWDSRRSSRARFSSRTLHNSIDRTASSRVSSPASDVEYSSSASEGYPGPLDITLTRHESANIQRSRAFHAAGTCARARAGVSYEAPVRAGHTGGERSSTGRPHGSNRLSQGRRGTGHS